MMRVSGFKLVILFSLSFLVFTSCNNGKVKVGVLIHMIDGRWSQDKDNITDEVKALGGEVIFRDAHDDQETQNDQAFELLNEGVDVLVVVASDEDSSAEIVRLAHDKGVKVIAYDRLIQDCDLDYYITTNSIRVGEMQAEYVLSLHPEGNYALIIGHEHDHNALLLFLGQMNVLQEHVERGDIRIVYSEYTENWTPAEGYEKTREMLLKSGGKVDVIITGSDALAYGVHKALAEAGLDDSVTVVSQDAELEIVRRIASGKHAATILKPLKEMARRTAEIAMKLAQDEPLEKDYSTVSNGKRLVPSYELEPELVTKDNILSTVIAEGYYSSQEIFNN